MSITIECALSIRKLLSAGFSGDLVERLGRGIWLKFE